MTMTPLVAHADPRTIARLPSPAWGGDGGGGLSTAAERGPQWDV